MPRKSMRSSSPSSIYRDSSAGNRCTRHYPNSTNPAKKTARISFMMGLGLKRQRHRWRQFLDKLSKM